MADAPARKGITGHVSGWLKGVLGLFVGVGSGVVVMYSNAIVNQVVRPTKPIANFEVGIDGLTVNLKNHAGGDSGWWDFGDGSALEPFESTKEVVSHTYAKPGNYSVKLTVRNMLLEDNERTVPVDLSAASPKTLPPSITGLKVEPFGGNGVAPASFRISGEVANAERVIFDLGNKPLVVDTENGPFEKYVVFETAGKHAVRLTGVSGKTAIKQETSVDVYAPQAGSVSVVARITDSGTTIDRRIVNSVAAIPLPKKGEKTFEKVLTAEPGFTVAKAEMGKLNAAVVKNVKLELAADRKSGKLVGEWAASGDALAKAAGGSDAMIPLILSEEKTTSVSLPPETVSGVIAGATGTAAINLPPMPRGLTDVKRTIQLQIVRAGTDGKQDVLHTEADLKPTWKGVAVSRPGTNYGFGAALAGNTLRVQMNQSR